MLHGQCRKQSELVISVVRIAKPGYIILTKSEPLYSLYKSVIKNITLFVIQLSPKPSASVLKQAAKSACWSSCRPKTHRDHSTGNAQSAPDLS